MAEEKKVSCTYKTIIFEDGTVDFESESMPKGEIVQHYINLGKEFEKQVEELRIRDLVLKALAEIVNTKEEE